MKISVATFRRTLAQAVSDGLVVRKLSYRRKTGLDHDPKREASEYYLPLLNNPRADQLEELKADIQEKLSAGIWGVSIEDYRKRFEAPDVPVALEELPF
jgi:hypothetical protein